MRKTFFVLCLFFSCFQSKANKIDSLKTDEDVITFIKPLLHEKFQIDQLDLSFSLLGNAAATRSFPCGTLSPYESLRKWGKADFNNDGLTDLFLNIYQGDKPLILVIITTSTNNYKIINLNKLHSTCVFGHLEKQGKLPLIILNEKTVGGTVINDTLQYINLVDNFAEIIKEHSPYNIESISVSTTECFGECPVFNLLINDKGISYYEAKEYNSQQGKFKATLDKKTTDSLFQYLDDIDFPNLNNKYSLSKSDQQTINITITYDQGKTKTISDYGAKGTFGLMGFYNLLFGVRDTQNWKKSSN